MTIPEPATVSVREWTIRRRVLLGFGSVIALLFLTGVVGTTMLRSARRQIVRARCR